MNRVSVILLVFSLILVILIAGCSATAPQVGKQAPDFQLLNLEEEPVSLSDFQGRPVLLNFWATWCGPCRQEMPLIQDIFTEESDTGLVILAIDVGEPPSAVSSFIQSNNFSFPVLLDTDQDVALE